MHAQATTTRAVFYLWIALLAVASLVVASPVPEPEPAPMDSTLAAIISSNLNLACQHGCPASKPLQLNENAALGSAANPLSIFGCLIIASSVLVAI